MELNSRAIVGMDRGKSQHGAVWQFVTAVFPMILIGFPTSSSPGRTIDGSMRLSLKLTIALIGVMTVIFYGYAHLALNRQNTFFREDMTRDGKLIGHTLAKAASTMWQTQGLNRALSFVEEINRDYPGFLIRFVWLDSSADVNHQPSIHLSKSEQERLVRGPVLVTRVSGSDPDYVYTFVTVQAPQDARPAALELRESFAPASRFVHVSGLRLAVFFAIVILSASAIMWLLGVFLVARPIAQLSEKARQIAGGDFSGVAIIKGRDEIASLATDINTMSEKLSEARALLNEETSAKIKAIEQLRHADRLTTIGTLASGLAHELGTPLNVITGRLQLCKTEVAQESSFKEHLEISLEQTQKMMGIISQLLDFSRSRTPNRHPADISVLAQKVIRTLAPFAGKRQTLLKFSSQVPSAIASVDATQIEQVITNLLLNAIQSMDGGDILVGLEVSAAGRQNPQGEVKGEHICLSVRDSGHGIAEANTERLFDPFYTTKPVGEGTGMGLSIAYGIVKDHGGWIDVQSQQGRGSVFSVFLPYQAGA